MSSGSLQPFLLAFEIGLILTGAWLLWRLLADPAWRTRWLKTNKLHHWPITLPEFLVLLLFMAMCGTFAQLIAQQAFGSMIRQALDRAGLEVAVYGGSLQCAVLLAWGLFPSFRKGWYADYGAVPPPLTGPTDSVPLPRPSWRETGTIAVLLLMLSVTVLGLISLGWNFLLHKFGYEAAPQDLLAIFTQTRSPAVLAAMLVAACVLAPLSEELFFRGCLYRYTRQHLGRGWGLLISGVLFGAIHGNLAGFVPLAALGCLLALAYEATGLLRVPVIAHGLFNLHTIVILLSGLDATL